MNDIACETECSSPAAEAWDAWDTATADGRYRTLIAIDYPDETRLYDALPGGRIERITHDQWCATEATRDEIAVMDRLMFTRDPRFRLLRRRLHQGPTPWLRIYPALRPGESVKSADPCIGGLGLISAL